MAKGDDSDTPTALFPALYTDSSIYEFKCQQGHFNSIVLKEQLFEVLYEVSAVAYVEGYYRDAVASSSAALERFYEFVIRLLLSEKIKDESIIEKVWKKVSRQSERQLGAYQFLFLSELAQEPITLSTDTTGLRNKVIHQGKIPTKLESLHFLEAVYGVIKDVLEVLHDKKYRSAIQRSISSHEKAVMKTMGEREYTHLTSGTIITLWNYSKAHYEQPLSVHLKSLIDKQKAITFTNLKNSSQ